MQTFQIYSLLTGQVVATHEFQSPQEAAVYRQRLQRQLGAPLGSLVPVNPELDAAHVRRMCDRYRNAQ